MSEDIILLTREDVSSVSSPSPESDCSPTEAFHLTESDCACPTDGFTLETHPLRKNGNTTFVRSELHVDELTEQLSLAFNPFGSAGVVLFNTPVRQLLQAFETPRSLTQGIEQARLSDDRALETAERLVIHGLLTPAGTEPTPQRSDPQTLTAWLHVTNACNLRCSYCYLHKTPDDMERERGRRSVEAVFRSAVTHGYRRVKLKYAGGEATLNFPLVRELHEYAQRLAKKHALELDGVVLSNGVGLTDCMIETMQRLDLRLMISLDGIGATHDAQRHFINGSGSFEHVERSLNRLAAHDFVPSISITVSQRNLDGLPETVQYVLDRELPFTINFYRENECSASFDDLTYQDEQIIAAMRDAFGVIRNNLPAYSLLDALVDRARLDAMHDRPCGAGDSYMVIDQNGRVAKCQMKIDQTITDVTAGDPLQVIREDAVGVQNVPVDEKEGCRECTWRYWCAGGCPALTYRVTGRYDVKSPNCRIYKALFPEVLRLEGHRILEYSEVAVD